MDDQQQQHGGLDQAELYRRLALAAVLLIVVGTVGFRWLEDDWSWVVVDEDDQYVLLEPPE